MEVNRERAPEQVRQQEMNINTRDRLFHAIFLKVGLVYSRAVPKAVRTGMEVLLLAKAIILFAVLSYVHFTFSKQPITCLESIQDSWPRDGILRVQVLLAHNSPIEGDAMPYVSVNRNTSLHAHCQTSLYRSNSTVDSTSAFQKTSTESTGYLQYFFDLLLEANQMPRADSVMDNTHFRKVEKLIRGYQSVKEHYVMEFSLEYGFLRLSTATRQKLKIPVQVVTLDPSTDKCFGDSVSKFLLNHFLGYDDVLIASIKRLAEMEDNRGFMRNVMTGEHYRFVSIWMSRSSYMIAFLLMFVFTISVATLLRFCHQQIFFFIVHLLQMLDWNLAVAFPVAPLFTVILSLVGMEVIMSEFFNDASTSFYIILIVWAADQFDSICCHTTISQKYWLRFFYLYHFVFYAYHYRFNGQYSSIALASSWFFIQHSMLYFLHNYELPAIENQAAREIEDDLTEALVDIAHAVQEVSARRDWLRPMNPGRSHAEVEGQTNAEQLERSEEDEPVLSESAFESEQEDGGSSLHTMCISENEARLSTDSDALSSGPSDGTEESHEALIDGASQAVGRDPTARGSSCKYEFLPENGTCVETQLIAAAQVLSMSSSQAREDTNADAYHSLNLLAQDSMDNSNTDSKGADESTTDGVSSPTESNLSSNTLAIEAS